jgi:hypothetical protein
MDTSNKYGPPSSPRTGPNAKEPRDGTKAKRGQLQRLHESHKRSRSLDATLVERQVKAEPSIEKSRSPRSVYDGKAIQKAFDHNGVVDRKILQSLIEDAFRHQGNPLSEKERDEFVAAFCNGATSRCDYVLDRLLAALTQKVDLSRLQEVVGGSRGWTFANLPTATADVERYAVHDIARQFADCKDEGSFKAALRNSLQQSKLTPEHAAEFMKNAKGLILEGRSAIVRDEIARHARQKI